MYIPIIVVVLYAFNADSVNYFPMRGASFKWFAKMAADDDLIRSLEHSLVIAGISTGVACVLGVTGGYGMYRFDFPGKSFMNKLVMLPLILPGILTGVALLTFYQAVGIHQGMMAVILGHSTFLIATAIISSALLSFTLSMDEIPVTYFLNGIFSTLPIQIWGMTRNGITPEVNAISSLIFIISLAAILISNMLSKED